MDKNHKLLFHGAKSRIEGKLDIHKSRTNNDLGQGFYTGERYEQAISFISGFEKSSVYIFDFKEEGLKGKKYNLREAISIDEAREISEQKLRLPQRLAQPWCAERVVKQLRIDMEQHTKEWQNNPMLEGELILFLDATNHVSLDEIRLFYDEKKGLEWEVEKRG